MRNFGHNVEFTPSRIYRPRSEDELLETLRRHSGEMIRARGSLHSWSGTAATSGVMIEMEKFDQVTPSEELHRPGVTVGAGCRLERLVESLDRHKLALPTNGGVLEQSISGAVSTGTHGSGNQSLSSFVRRVRIARIDSNGDPEIRDVSEGPPLLAARCSLGALGIITELELEASPRWSIEERFESAPSLDDVLSGEDEWPLQQFLLLPYRWEYYVFRRRRVEIEPSWLRSHLYKTYNVVTLDALAHLIFKGVVTLQRLGSNGAVIGFFKHALPRLLVTGMTVTGDSTLISTTNHHWFRHVEMEIFVPAPALPKAMRMIQQLTAFYAGDGDTISKDVMAILEKHHIKDTVLACRGFYAHHYPIFMRRVLPDDTLISMSSPRENEPWWYSISLFSYMQPRTRYYMFANTIMELLRREFGARPHWGKYHRLVREEIEPLYPRLDEFRDICREFDPAGIFTNDYSENVLGLARRNG